MLPLSKLAYVREETAMNFFMYIFQGLLLWKESRILFKFSYQNLKRSAYARQQGEISRQNKCPAVRNSRRISANSKCLFPTGSCLCLSSFRIEKRMIIFVSLHGHSIKSASQVTHFPSLNNPDLHLCLPQAKIFS